MSWRCRTTVPMRILSWNLNARRDSKSQVLALAALEPEIVVLQEVTLGSQPRLCELLSDHGLTSSVSGLDVMERGTQPPLPRFVMIASRWPIALMEPVDVPSPEVALHVTAYGPGGPLEVVGVHIPVASRIPPLKPLTQEGVAALLKDRAASPLVLCGDFNAPRGETPSGEVIPFSTKRGPRAREAELGLMSGIREFGFEDCFRTVNGYAVDTASWYWRQRGVNVGFRIDHAFASASLQTSACWYEHGFREARLSDHSPIVADVLFRPRSTGSTPAGYIPTPAPETPS